VVNRERADLAPSAQLSCVLTCRAEGEEQARGVEPVQVRGGALADFPNLTSLHLTATDCSELPDSRLSVPESLQHLWIRGPEGSWPLPLLQGLPRFRSLETLSVFGQGLPEVAWPLSASLRILDLGVRVTKAPDTPVPGILFQTAWRRTCDSQELSGGLLLRIAELRELPRAQGQPLA